MSGVAWRLIGSKQTASRLPWLRPPHAALGRQMIQARPNTRAGSSACTLAPPRTRCLIVRAPVAVTRSFIPGARMLAVLQPPLEASLSRSGPLEWPADLLDYQLIGIRLLLDRDRLLLADEMGLGKTIEAIAAIRLLARRGAIASCLITVPAAVFTYWMRQLERWAPELRTCAVRGAADDRAPQWRMPAHVHVVSYETLRSDAHLSRDRIWDLVVIDEAQKIKNPDSEIASAVKHLPRRRAWGLTGTPLENRLADLASILEFVAPRLPDQRPLKVIPGEHLRDELSTIQLRRRKQDVLAELPPKTLIDLPLELTPDQRSSYERAENEGRVYLKELGSSVSIANVLELILRLKQLCNFAPESGSSAKLADLDERLATLAEAGQRALVFSQFADEYFGAAAIAARLERYRPVLYTGAMTLAERDAAVQRFQDDRSRQLMVLSLRAGGQGLNLQAASYVFHFDRWWNPSVEAQATDRSHRLGQRQPVHVYAYTIENSIEERIRDILEGTGIDVRKFGRDDLFRMVGLATPA